MSEQELRNAFAELAGEVKPAPEPYARLMARSRRRRFSRWATGFAAAVAAVVIAPVALNAANDPGPDLGIIDNSVLMITPWTRKLIDAPVRGGLAGDPKLVDEAGKALRVNKSGPMSGYPIKVLFIEDVGDKRIVVAVRHSKTHQVGLVMAAPRGARGEQLITAEVRIKSLSPFTATEFGFGLAHNLTHVGIGLAPPGCEIDLATLASGAPKWRASGDYVVWSQSIADQLVRVTCAGAVRFQGALLDLSNMMQITGDLEGFRTATTAGSGFVIPGAILEQMLQGTYPPQSVGQLRAMFAGAASGMANPAYVAADPVDKDRWRVQIFSGSSSARLLTSANVLAPDAVVALDVPDSGSVDTMLVLGPPSAVKLEIRDLFSGVLLQSVPLANGVAVVRMRAAEDMWLHTFNAAGELVGFGVTPLPKPEGPSELSMPETTENWG
ncbi:hypothetical protein Rhe02_14130 [Rhizocola hellebori]|uniref:Uncharacterized protein n=1 Tax=Rhizocola hellebori TaxID=1392758 RepID=A0A8J3Q455_9ACTN|nr:hypothetical protein [Rhizocola hellebori]GIH03346.1 hypothetical protein Rhe02_14130 [Rhizocola hellebori]